MGRLFCVVLLLAYSINWLLLSVSLAEQNISDNEVIGMSRKRLSLFIMEDAIIECIIVCLRMPLEM